MDHMLDQATKNSPTAAWALTHGMYCMGVSTPRAYVAAALEYHLRDGIATAISCPTLVCEAEDDIFFWGQPQELYDHLTCPKTLMRFTLGEGAGAHCQVGAAGLPSGVCTIGSIKRSALPATPKRLFFRSHVQGALSIVLRSRAELTLIGGLGGHQVLPDGLPGELSVWAKDE